MTGFRCLDSFKLDPDRINIFVGRNNTGKSSVLEAVAIGASSAAGYHDALGEDILVRFAKRHNWRLQYFVRLGSDSSVIKILRGNQSSIEEAAVTLNYLSDIKSEALSDSALARLAARASEMARQYPSRYMVDRRGLVRDPREMDAETLAREHESEEKRFMEGLLQQPKLLVTCGDREEILLQQGQQILKSVPAITSWPETYNVLFSGANYETGLKELHDKLLPTARFAAVMDQVKDGIDYLADLRTLQDEIFVYQRKLDRPIPISLMGDGFREMLRIAFMSVLTRGGIAVLEEPENSLHPGFLGLATDYLSRAAVDGKTQFFISTHSLEFVQYMLEKAADGTKIIRMSQTDNKISYEVLNGKEAVEESKDIGTDLRGV